MLFIPGRLLRFPDGSLFPISAVIVPSSALPSVKDDLVLISVVEIRSTEGRDIFYPYELMLRREVRFLESLVKVDERSSRRGENVKASSGLEPRDFREVFDESLEILSLESVILDRRKILPSLHRSGVLLEDIPEIADSVWGIGNDEIGTLPEKKETEDILLIR